jgi:hypothetical protein
MSSNSYIQDQVVYDIHTKEKYTLIRRVNDFSDWWWVTVEDNDTIVKRPERLFRGSK